MVTWTYADLTRIYISPGQEVICLECRRRVPETVVTSLICRRDDERVGPCALCRKPAARGDIVPPLPEGAIDFFAVYAAGRKVKDS